MAIHPYGTVLHLLCVTYEAYVIVDEPSRTQAPYEYAPVASMTVGVSGSWAEICLSFGAIVLCFDQPHKSPATIYNA